LRLLRHALGRAPQWLPGLAARASVALAWAWLLPA